MGYSNYCERRPMSQAAWEAYAQQMRILYRVLWQGRRLKLFACDLSEEDGGRSPWGCMVPIARRHGCVTFSENRCEPFQMGREQQGFWSCKTNLAPYDFAVKAALVLLTELGGAECISCDHADNDEAAFAEVLAWLQAQPGLPDTYPMARMVLRQSTRRMLRKEFRDAVQGRRMAPWIQSDRLQAMLQGKKWVPEEGEDPTEIDYQRLCRRIGLRILSGLRRSVDHKRKMAMALCLSRAGVAPAIVLRHGFP